MGAQGSGFDMSKMSTASKITLGATLVYFIDSFLPWNRACFGGGQLFGVNVPSACASANLWHGVGFIAVLLALALLVEEGMKVAGVKMSINMPVGTVVLGLAGGIVLFTILKILIDHSFLSWGAWLGLILSLVIGYGGYLRFQEEKAMTPPPMAPPPPPAAG